MMKSLAEQMSVYHRCHRKLITKLTHFIGVPAIIFSLQILLSWVDVGISGWADMSVSWWVILFLIIYYVVLDYQLAIGTGVVLIVLNVIAEQLSGLGPNWFAFKVAVIVFVVAWIIQLIGHLFEGKRPALVDNFFQVLIAPIFLTAEVAFMLGKKQDLKKRVEALANIDATS
jgi:uncharacterized membrane protein YGL010W